MNGYIDQQQYYANQGRQLFAQATVTNGQYVNATPPQQYYVQQPGVPPPYYHPGAPGVYPNNPNAACYPLQQQQQMYVQPPQAPQMYVQQPQPQPAGYQPMAYGGAPTYVQFPLMYNTGKKPKGHKKNKYKHKHKGYYLKYKTKSYKGMKSLFKF